MLKFRYILAAVAAIVISLTAASYSPAAIVRDANGQIVRNAQNNLNRSSIPFPSGLSLTYVRGLPAEQSTDTCGYFDPNTWTIYNVCDRGTLYHEVFHAVARRNEGGTWELKVTAAYRKLRPELTAGWWDQEVAYDQQTQEHAANDFEYCASFPRSEWKRSAYFDRTDRKVCEMFLKMSTIAH